MRDYATGKWLRVERQTSEHEAILFCGDPIAFISCHFFPACMHRPDALEMARQAPHTRISAPFFLYPDKQGTFDAACMRAELLDGESDDSSGARGRRKRVLQRPSPSTLSAEVFKFNVGNCREEWPWKGEEYYSGRVLCRDSDHFPGLEAEGVMDYDD